MRSLAQSCTNRSGWLQLRCDEIQDTEKHHEITSFCDRALCSRYKDKYTKSCIYCMNCFRHDQDTGKNRGMTETRYETPQFGDERACAFYVNP